MICLNFFHLFLCQFYLFVTFFRSCECNQTRFPQSTIVNWLWIVSTIHMPNARNVTVGSNYLVTNLDFCTFDWFWMLMWLWMYPIWTLMWMYPIWMLMWMYPILMWMWLWMYPIWMLMWMYLIGSISSRQMSQWAPIILSFSWTFVQFINVSDWC